MALVSMRQLLDHAGEYGEAPAFNVNNMEQIQAIMQAADECDSPVILQGSAGAGNMLAKRSCAIWSRRRSKPIRIFRWLCIKITAKAPPPVSAQSAQAFRAL